jgi:hypothetical protein
MGISKLNIHRIECLSQHGLCGGAVVESLAHLPGTRLVKAKSEVVKVLSSSPLVESYTVGYNLPSSIRVEIIERKPDYAFRALAHKAAALVDQSGYVLSYANDYDQSEILTDTPLPSVGDRLTGAYLSALELYVKTDLISPINSAKIQQSNFYVDLQNGIQVIYPLDSDADMLTGSLVLLLARLNSGREELTIETATSLDLRFRNPVLK